MKQEIFKIVLTGPESSGKTTLAMALAESLQTVWVPEFARFYVPQLGRPYQRDDLVFIAKGQSAWEEWYARQADRFLVCDTDWTVLVVWEQYGFGTNPNTQAPKHPNTLYFLCAPDFPWKPDPLREHPGEREVLFTLYEALLQQIGAEYVVLRGDADLRLKTALELIATYSI